MDARRRIESDMERFKVCEKETKTKVRLSIYVQNTVTNGGDIIQTPKILSLTACFNIFNGNAHVLTLDWVSNRHTRKMG